MSDSFQNLEVSKNIMKKIDAHQKKSNLNNFPRTDQSSGKKRTKNSQQKKITLKKEKKFPMLTDLVTLTVRLLDSNWWCSVIKQSYLYKNRVNLHFIIVIKLFVCV